MNEELMRSGTVSVVVPCYRCSRTIMRAIGSVAAQTIRPLEVIIVDDASGDGTLDSLLEVQEKYGGDWIRIVRMEKNAGPGSARNAGWDVARGRFVAFLDADDSWHPKKIEWQRGWMQENPDIVMTGHKVPVIEDISTPQIFQTAGGFQKLTSRFLFLTKNRFPTSSVMLHRTVEHRFEPGKRYSEDFHLWMRIFCAGGRVAVSRDVLAFYHKPAYGAGGLTGNLRAMADGAMDTFCRGYEEGLLKHWEKVGLQGYSYLKYLRRVLKTWGRRVLRQFRVLN